MNFKKLGIAVAVSTALGGGMVGQANAQEQAVGQALLNITSLLFSTIDPTTQTRRNLTPSDFTTFTFLDNFTNTSRLNGVFGPTTGFTGSTFVNVENAPLSCIGTCPSIAENDFTAATRLAQVPPGSTFSQSDSLATGVPLNTGGLFDLGSNIHTSADTDLASGPNSGDASSVVNNTTTITFKLSQPIGSLGINFSADDLIRAWTAPGTTVGTLAGAGITWTLSLSVQGSSTPLIAWTPDGVVGGGVETGLTVTADGCNLQQTASATFNDQQGAIQCSGVFAATSSIALSSDLTYSLKLTQTSVSNATTVGVPEPATLALLGLGMAGLGLVRRRRTTA